MVDRIGPKRTLQITLWIWVALLIGMVLVPTKTAFWFVGLAIGLNFGGGGAAERPRMLSLLPDAEFGRYFSLMLLSARVAAIAGPFLWGYTIKFMAPSVGTPMAYRAAVLTVDIMFVIALFILKGVPDKRESSGPAVTPA